MLSSEIRYFLAVVNSGSLSAASEQLFVAVSAISRQIQRLEAQVGAPLFERHARGMVLNEAGEIFAHHVRKSQLDMEYALAEIKGLKAVRRTQIRITCTDGMAFSLLPGLLAEFRCANPGVLFTMKVTNTQGWRNRSAQANVMWHYSSVCILNAVLKCQAPGLPPYCWRCTSRILWLPAPSPWLISVTIRWRCRAKHHGSPVVRSLLSDER